jgi:hypothetical protein
MAGAVFAPEFLGEKARWYPDGWDVNMGAVGPADVGALARPGRRSPPEEPNRTKESVMTEETGRITGTRDKDYNIIWFTEQCLSNVLRLETYAADAERAGDTELATFFRRAQGESRKGAEQGKELLRARV